MAAPVENIEMVVPDIRLGKAHGVSLEENMNYVAAGMCLRGDGDDTEVLLIQEAKKEERGKWYMPAGRVDPGETLVNAVKREVEEESGLTCDVISLVTVEVQGTDWYRFSYYCENTSGILKSKPDKESLKAERFLVSDVRGGNKNLPLRDHDFIPLIRAAVEFRGKRNSTAIVPVMPLNINIPGLFLEFMFVWHSRDGSRTEVLVRNSVHDEVELLQNDQPFPTVEYGFEYDFALTECYNHFLEDGAKGVFKPSHITRVKCHPNPGKSRAQGISLRLFCQHKKFAMKPAKPGFHWIAVEDAAIRGSMSLDREQHRPVFTVLPS